MTRFLAQARSRRGLAFLLALAPVAVWLPGDAKDNSALQRRRKRAEKRASRRQGGKSRKSDKDKNKNTNQNKRAKKGKAKGTGFSAKCERFVISAGPNRTDRFKHTDDDLFIELLPTGGTPKVLFKDDNDAPNGPGGSHLVVEPFDAQVGDRIRIVARNEVAGGCELDAIWLHCIEKKGGSVKLLDAITPAECKKDADKVGVFLDTTVRIRNK
ncbi:MAG: hypothetical protein KC442_19025 [Thermomicrobiales bacterium]|nr:hypothetical protein [Thermomicrobiales bacterium]